jgi:dihydroorotase
MESDPDLGFFIIKAMQDSITITRPDDWHCHLRDGEVMASVVGATARQFGRAIVMPNLKPPVVDVKQAGAYRDRIRAALPHGTQFEPLMTLYLTDNTPPDEIARARASGFVHAVKYYPAGATTNSALGVSDIRKCDAVLEAMQAAGMPLLVHGEVTDAAVDIFDREAVFLERTLASMVRRFPKLKIVVEHMTTREAVTFVERAGPNVGGTITAHHLLMNRNSIFTGGIRPHHYCLPVLKREEHRQALVKAATSGNPKFFLGTDTAPHARGMKEHECGAAGMYTAHAALELYAEAFEAAGALDRLEAFASHFGADFYGLPRNSTRVTLERSEWEVPREYPFGAETVVPLRAGQKLRWRFAGP